MLSEHRPSGRYVRLFEMASIIDGGLELTAALQYVAESALDLTGARYGALAVWGAGADGPGQTFTAGAPDVVSRHEREGRGQPTPDARSLNAPVRVRGDVLGHLYLAEPRVDGTRPDGFTADDEATTIALAAVAGLTIASARAHAEAMRRQRWMAATAEITTRMLATDADGSLGLVADTLWTVAEADVVTLVLPTADGQQFSVEVAVGPQADAMRGYVYPREGSLAERAIKTLRPLSVQRSDGEPVYLHQRLFVEVDATMVVPLAGSRGPRGALVVGRLPGRPPFTEDDLGMATAFAAQAALALEIADSHNAASRLGMLEDRERIARDLHDHVIQRLFALGLAVQGLAGQLVDHPSVDRLNAVTTGLDDTISQIRTTIFDLRGRVGATHRSIKSDVLEVIDELTDEESVSPAVRFHGPVDHAVDPHLASDVLAVVREGLSNAVRHAAAGNLEVVVAVDADEIRVQVADDGRGVGGTLRRSGLVSLGERANRRGGTLEVESPREGLGGKGTKLTWSAPIGDTHPPGR